MLPETSLTLYSTFFPTRDQYICTKAYVKLPISPSTLHLLWYYSNAISTVRLIIDRAKVDHLQVVHLAGQFRDADVHQRASRYPTGSP